MYILNKKRRHKIDVFFYLKLPEVPSKSTKTPARKKRQPANNNCDEASGDAI